MSDPIDDFRKQIAGDARARSMLDAMVQAERDRLTRQRVAQTEVKEVPLVTTGSFAPTLVGAGTAGTFVYTANATIVEWTRIANRIYWNGRVAISAITVPAVGNMTIRGWPAAITPVSDANMAIAGGGTMLGYNGLTLAAGYTQVEIQAANGSLNFAILKSGSGVALASVTGGEVVGAAGAVELRFFGVYRVA